MFSLASCGFIRDKTGDTWEPITHLQGYTTMVKVFNESHEKDVERLTYIIYCFVLSQIKVGSLCFMVPVGRSGCGGLLVSTDCVRR